MFYLNSDLDVESSWVKHVLCTSAHSAERLNTPWMKHKHKTNSAQKHKIKTKSAFFMFYCWPQQHEKKKQKKAIAHFESTVTHLQKKRN